MGKSRLVIELRHYCDFRGCHFLETKYDELGTSRPYEKLFSPLLVHLLSVPDERSQTILDGLGPFLPHTAELLPGLEIRVDEGVAGTVDAEGAARHRMFSEASSILGRIAQDQPAVFMIDDLQWIPAHDLEMLGYLARNSTSSSVLFVATMRTPVEGYPEVHRQVGVLSKLVPFLTLELDDLPEEYAGHMVMFALKDPHIPRSVLHRLVRQSGGNPFYLRELLKSLRERGSISPAEAGGWDYMVGEEVPLPESISQVVSARLDSLDDFSREVLRTGSLALGSFTLDLVSAVLEKPELDIARALEEPLRMDLVSERIGEFASPEYRFNHDTVRSFLYGEFNHGVRKALNSRFGEYYEKRYHRGSSSDLTRVAHYFSDSLDGEKARTYTLMAARDALSRQSNIEALSWLKRYRTVAEGAEESREDAFFSYSQLGRLYTMVADHESADTAFEKAIPLASDDLEKGLVSAELGQMHYNTGDYEKAEQELHRALELLPTGERSIRARMRLAFMSHLRGDSDRATDIFLESRDQIDRVEDEATRKRLMASYCSGAGFVLAHSRSMEEGLELCRQATRLYRELGDRTGEARAILNLAAILSSGGNWEERIAILTRAVDVLTETGDTHSIMVAYVNLGQVYYSLLQKEMSREFFERCLALVEATGTRRFEVWCRCYLGMICEQDEDYEQARQYFDAAIASAQELGLARMLVVSRVNLALMLLQKGDFREAMELVELVEKDGTVEQMGASMSNGLLTARALELYLNREAGRDRAASLEEAIRLFRRARSDPAGGADALNFVENSFHLARCIEEVGNDEWKEVVEEACEVIESTLSSIKSSIYRQSMGEMESIRELLEMRERLT